MEKIIRKGFPEYSVAIRTLGLDPETLTCELESVMSQTVSPAKVVVYIADGFKIPADRVGREIYVATKKGMVAQRAMDYREIDSPLILLLDDDVRLANDSVERLIEALESNELDCIAADTFCNHRLSLKNKIYAAITNLTLPHLRHDYAFRIHSNGSFSYINNPKHDVYLSQTAGGPCSLWRKEALITTAFADELWMDHMGFAYNDDGMEFFKLYSNGGRLGIHFNSGVSNEDARTASDSYRSDPRRLATRAKAIYLCWHRSLYMTSRSHRQCIYRLLAFWTKAAWLIPVHLATAIMMKDFSAMTHYFRGICDGIRYTRTQEYRDLPPYYRK